MARHSFREIVLMVLAVLGGLGILLLIGTRLIHVTASSDAGGHRRSRRCRGWIRCESVCAGDSRRGRNCSCARSLSLETLVPLCQLPCRRTTKVHSPS